MLENISKSTPNKEVTFLDGIEKIWAFINLVTKSELLPG